MMILNKPCNGNEYAKFAIYCNEHNCTIVEKEDYFEAAKNIKSLEELKREKLNELKLKNEEYFYSVYPFYKQNNIAIFGTDDEKESFKLFYQEQMKKYDAKIREINSKKSLKGLGEIDMSF